MKDRYWIQFMASIIFLCQCAGGGTLLSLIHPQDCLAQNTQTQYGMNVEPSNYFSSDAMFVDLMMQASGWWNNPPTPFTLSPEGYPNTPGVTVTSLLFMDGRQPGDYQFYGEGDFTFSGRGLKQNLQKLGNITTGTITINNINPPCHGIFGNGDPTSSPELFDLTCNDAGNPPRNFHLIAPGYAPYPDNKVIFTREYLASLANFKCIRVMDWMQTNTTAITTWASRPRPNWFGDGGANYSYETFIDLANILNADLWICIPVNATDDWTQNMSSLLASRLNPNLHVYYEYSNECWNYGFPQWSILWNEESILPQYPPFQDDGGWAQLGKLVALRLMHHRDIIQPVLGSRGRPILSGQLGNTTYCAAGLGWIADHYGPPSDYIFGISGASYFGVSGSTTTTPSNSDDLFSSVASNIKAEISQQLAQNCTLAAKYSVKMTCYESGQSLWSGDATDFAIGSAAQYDSRMGDMYRDLGNVLSSQGVFLNNFYDNCGHDSQYGFWGALTDIRYAGMSGEPKYNAEVSLAGPITAPANNTGGNTGKSKQHNTESVAHAHNVGMNTPHHANATASVQTKGSIQMTKAQWVKWLAELQAKNAAKARTQPVKNGQ